MLFMLNLIIVSTALLQPSLPARLAVPATVVRQHRAVDFAVMMATKADEPGKDFSWAAPRLALLAMAATCGANVSRQPTDRIYLQFTDYIRDFCACLLYTSPSPRDATLSRMPSSA